MKNISSILGHDGPVARSMPGYEYRPQQIEAAASVDRALSTCKHCIVEAGTGVGKSLAYLLPAILHASPERKVIISTHTLYLQSQLIEKDIPFLQSVLPEHKFRAVLMKGRGNYLCLSNFDAELGQLHLMGDPNLNRLREWAERTESGDVSELDFKFRAWQDVCSNLDTCRRQDCRYFGKCHYYRARKAAQDAEIVVTNHSLFFSDLMIRQADPNAGILPVYNAVIFDEAHHLEDVATRAFSVEYSTWQMPHFLTRLRRARGLDLSAERVQAIEELNDELFASFARGGKPEFFFSDIHGEAEMAAVSEIASRLCSLLEGLTTDLGKVETEGNPDLKERLEGLKRSANRLREELLSLFFGVTEGYFRWGERSTGRAGANCSLRSSPLGVSDILRDSLWDQLGSGVLTSATLSNSGTFNYVKARLGLAGCIEAIEDSPFDFKSNCLLYVPKHLDFPSEQAYYADKVADEVEQIVRASGGRAFVLFTSYRMLNNVYDRLFGRLPYVMLKQGDMSNEALIQEYRRQDLCCLFGVHSFWEGVDIRGEALSCVIIDKLPFAVPDSPMNRARVQSITDSGGDWFSEYSMPQAQIRLKQGFGRLIRTAEDRGVVAILDSRLAKKPYGREFMRFLPQCRVTVRMDEVKAFFQLENR